MEEKWSWARLNQKSTNTYKLKKPTVECSTLNTLKTLKRRKTNQAQKTNNH
jgi:hypothetical protein